MKLSHKIVSTLKTVTLLALALVAAPAHAGDAVPFHAVYETEFSVEVTPPLAAVSATGTGLATHLGRMGVESISEIVNLATGEGLASYRYTAANGDAIEVEINFNVAPTPTGFTSSGSWRVTSGTGRFADAAGSGSITGLIEFTGADVGVANLTLDGVISSPGSL
jgi:hypothetical protein